MAPSIRGRVGIVTIQDDSNFGNRLQNFALQEVIHEMGWKVESIQNRPPRMARTLLASRAVHALLTDGPVVFGRRNAALLRSKLGGHGTTDPGKYADERRTAIAAFSQERVITSDVDYRDRTTSEWAERYDAVVVGSDQIWNHGFRNAQEIDFGTFMTSSRRIAYAASFGVHDVPSFLRARYRMWLKQIPHLSVREQRGAEIVAGLTHRQVPVVVDPTLLLDRRAWQAIANPVPGMTDQDDPYAVQFFLGTATKPQLDWVADRAAREGVRLIDLHDLETEKFAALDPAGFVSALGGARFVATDSFHAGVFSLIQHTPIVVRSRDETDSRLHTLFDQHGIVRVETGVPGLTSALDPDWDRADALVSREREASWEFLHDAVNRAGGRPEGDA